MTAPSARLSHHPGRCLRWDARGHRWWWAGSGAHAVHALAEQDPAPLACRLPDAAGLLAHCVSGRVLLGLSKRLGFSEPGRDTGPRQLRVQPLVAVDAAEPRTAISDGCTDRRGFLVFGTRNVAKDGRAIGSFYQFSGKYGLRRLALPVVAEASAICFSADGKRMFFADARASQLLACDYDAERGRVGGVKVFAQLDAGATPRGAVLDAADCLWNAQAGQLVQYAPDGKVVRRIALDCSSIAFGGAGLTQLAAVGEGGLFTVSVPGVAGQPDSPFDDHPSQ
ncbi:SMP-30/gluconolactonase/LRE family protein [Massilia pseudoviolaceinigra]|uniref:SMP-30/gluconolactonase/LRE family protein n=1 Tax=Massilia pseudoviolaceinigra TaxID=3057165 RepID=UPI002796949B|nr:SMP-30/gluconolactonase/LRE family protein [Massilia sp. CCM 9206]MDQ1922422.1 SMP-30/gluconolactonase/LRE family protein [Massilia sp. CCM 9206]